MSPEQVMGTVVDARSDVFAAGAVFYQLISGHKPFAAKKLPQVLNNVIKESPAPIPDTTAPPDLTAIIMKALEKDPAARYQHMIEMLAALMRFRQAWDRETRELAIKACDQYRENERLLAERGAGEDVAAAVLLRDLPLFQERGADVLKVMPFRRSTILEITRLLGEQRSRLRT